MNDFSNNNMNDDETCIGSSTVITGGKTKTIVCDGNIVVKGQVKGACQVTGSMTIQGAIEGNIEANEVILGTNAKLVGNVNSKTNTTTKEGSQIDGNVQSKSASISSKVVGNLSIGSDLSMTPTGAIVGNIVAGNIAVSSGAVIEGNVSIRHGNVEVPQQPKKKQEEQQYD